jgi:Uma2 family endonuclease
LWNESLAEPRGEVLVGEAGIRLSRNPDSTVGVDVAYISAEVAAASPPDYPYLDGVPVLIVEVLSPSDKQEEISEKVEAYLKAGVKLVLIAEPVFKTITVYRPDGDPQLFSISQTFEAGSAMPGLRISLRDIFEK